MKKKEVEKLEKEPEEQSEEYKRFEHGLKTIFGLSTEEARKIREEFPVNPSEEIEEENS
jgi:hypothetical protein